MKNLLEKTRSINKLIQRAAGNPVDFEEMAKVLSQAVEANCYIVGRRGRILGFCFMPGFACGIMEEIVMHSERFPESYNEGLMKVLELSLLHISHPTSPRYRAVGRLGD